MRRGVSLPVLMPCLRCGRGGWRSPPDRVCIAAACQMKNGCRTQSLFDRVRTSASAYGALRKSHDVVNEERKTERRVLSNNRAVCETSAGTSDRDIV